MFDTPAAGAEFVAPPGMELSVPVAASDPDSGDVVSLAAVSLPAGATFSATSGNPATEVLSWTPTGNQGGTHGATFSATDDTGSSAPPLSIVIVVPNQPPVAACQNVMVETDRGVCSAAASVDIHELVASEPAKAGLPPGSKPSRR